MSRYVACEYICEKICAVSSSAGLPFRGGLATAQRPDGLEVTPTPAGILSPLYKYLYHLKNSPEACSIQCQGVLGEQKSLLFCDISCHFGRLIIGMT